YQTLRSEGITIEVARGSGEEAITSSAGRPGSTTRESVKFLGQDIRYIKSGSVVLKPADSFLFGSTLFILGYIIPLLLFIAIYLLNKKRIKENADLARVKNRKANKLAKKRLKKSAELLKKGNKEGFFEELTRALWGYTGDKLSIPGSSLTKDNARSILLDNGADQDTTNEFLSILDTCEYARYSPTNDHGERDELYKKSIATISKLEGQLKKKK
ncbi:MAG: protein BatD, partial [Methanosarcina mazei]